MYKLIKFLLFLLSPEKAHEVALHSLTTVLKIPIIGKWVENSFQPKPQEPIEVAGVMFPNALGLAAGFDKNAKWLHLLKSLGFGHVEIGTVTPKPQDGNPKPRLFRLPKDKALINRMGFNNDGVEAVVERLKNRPDNLVVGGNIGKNKTTPNEDAISDYITAFESIYDHVDYLVINISSPNTPGLRELQEDKFITELFQKLQDLRQLKNNWKPIFLKIAPDFSKAEITQLVDTIKRAKVDGVIASNTTISRKRLKVKLKTIKAIGDGGLSGQPLYEASNSILVNLALQLGGEIPLIGVGGVFTANEFQRKLNLGASLVQVYTGFIYEGPQIVKKILS
jgi:dihydroorotate dehydrogenase